MKKHISLFEAIAVIIGTIIGAGVIGIPYVFAQAGFWTGSLVLAVVALALIVTRLMLGEVILRTESSHQLVGYTERYLGWGLKQLQAVILIAGILGTLLAYMIAQGDILSALLPDLWRSWPVAADTAWALVFYAVFGVIFLQGLDIIKRSELLLTLLIFLIVVVITFFSAPEINWAYLSEFDLNRFFLPYGVILFACAGLVSIPEARQALRRDRAEHKLLPAIIYGGILPPILYFIFAGLVVGVAGLATDQVATVSLGQLGTHVKIIVNLFAFFAVATSFLTLALAAQEILRFDYRLSGYLANSLVLATPLVGFLLGLRDFIVIINIVGALTVGINGLFAVAAWWRARQLGDREPEYRVPFWFGATASIFLVILFSAGLVFAFI